MTTLSPLTLHSSVEGGRKEILPQEIFDNITLQHPYTLNLMSSHLPLPSEEKPPSQSSD